MGVAFVVLQACDLKQTLLHPRFAVENVKPDGAVKVRPVDHFSWSAFGKKKEDSVNGHVHPSEKLKHDTLDMLAEVLVDFVRYALLVLPCVCRR